MIGDPPAIIPQTERLYAVDNQTGVVWYVVGWMYRANGMVPIGVRYMVPSGLAEPLWANEFMYVHEHSVAMSVAAATITNIKGEGQ